MVEAAFSVIRARTPKPRRDGLCPGIGLLCPLRPGDPAGRGYGSASPPIELAHSVDVDSGFAPHLRLRARHDRYSTGTDGPVSAAQ